MKKIVSGLLVASLGLVSIGTTALLADKPSKMQEKGKAELTKVADFLEKNVMGRTLVREHHDTIAQGTIYTDFVARTTFHGLERTENGLRYLSTNVIEQTMWDLDKAGKKKGESRSKDRTIIARYNVNSNKATGALTGYSSFISSTTTDTTGAASAIRSLKVVDDTLELWIEKVNYGSCYAKDDTYKPCAHSAKSSYHIEDGKLVKTSVTTMYDVNPETFEKTKYAKNPTNTKTVKEK